MTSFTSNHDIINGTFITTVQGDKSTATYYYPTGYSSENGVQLVGLGTPVFTIIHATALVSLSTSALVSAIMLVVRCCFFRSAWEVDKRANDWARSTAGLPQGSGGRPDVVRETWIKTKIRKKRRSFWKWYIGERIVIYLAICDLCTSISHMLDHSWIQHMKEYPPMRICQMFAFILQTFGFSQWSIVSYSAISCCSLIVFGIRLKTGRYDWRLIVLAYGIPAAVGIIALCFNALGPSGAWCYINAGSVSGHLYGQILSVTQIILFTVLFLSYGSIWIKIRQTERRINQHMAEHERGGARPVAGIVSEGDGRKGGRHGAREVVARAARPNSDRYGSSIKVMMIFVMVFILQWWPLILHNIWVLFAPPPPAVIILLVIMLNLGGVYNCFAYTIIRRQRRTRKGESSAPSAAASEYSDAQQGYHPATGRRDRVVFIISASDPAASSCGEETSRVVEDAPALLDDVIISYNNN